MIYNLSVKVVDWIVKNDPESTAKHEELVYILQCLIERLISYGVLFTVAFIIGMPLQALVWTAFYTLLRFHIGGSHAETYLGCLISGTIFTIGCVLAVPFLAQFPILLVFETLFSIIVTFKVAPVVHPNKYLSPENTIKKHKHGKILVLVETAAVALLYVFCVPWVSQCAALGMCMASVFCVIGKLQYSKTKN